MYAVVSSGGKQYRVEPGSTLTIERVAAEAGATLTFDRVLLIGDGDEVTVGTPVVTGASVSATVLGEELGPKLVIFKFKQKVKYRRRTGHRQHLMRVRIDTITSDGRSTAAEPKAEPEPKAKAESTATPEPKAKAEPRARVKSEPEADAPSAKARSAPKPARPRASRAKPAAAGGKAEADATPPSKPRPARRASRAKAQE